jgi:hypothetical protein
MSNIESIENKLSELIPSSVSQQGLDRIDETIERLAQESLASGDSLGVTDVEGAAGPNLRWYHSSQWRIAAVFAILAVCSFSLAMKVGLLEISLKSASVTPHNSPEIIKQPEDLQVVKAVVSSSNANEDNYVGGLDRVMPEDDHIQRVSDPLPGPELMDHGIATERPSADLYTELPQLPYGSGLLLKAVSKDGAAAEAGLQAMDVICKVDDQLIINEKQFLALLAMRQCGDKVSVTYFRSGKKNITAMEIKDGSAMLTGSKDINSTASISDSGGTATLMYRNGKLWLRIESAKGSETYNGHIDDEHIAKVPSEWRNRISILQRSIEESSEIRQAYRMRYIPKAKNGFVDSDDQ